MTAPMAHVFIVDNNTFPLHLEYQFAGTTAGIKQSKNISLFADIARVRPGHRAYFYLLRQGFYGPFVIDPEHRGVWWDNNDPTFLQEQLKLRLIYRVNVVHENTYPLGVSEWDSLDKYLREPKRCLWSLIYRKLKGERGCTMIFPWEDDFLFHLIQQRNEQEGRIPLCPSSEEHLSWNREKREIEVRPGPFFAYESDNKASISLPEDPVGKLRLAAGSEAQLQAYLTHSYGRFATSDVVFGKAETIQWVGNEVDCGVGMQKIDIFVINQEENTPIFRVIELKKDPPDRHTVEQFYRYIEWTKRFIPGATSQNIQPILLCRNRKATSLTASICDSFRIFNSYNLALPIKYIECRMNKSEHSVYFQEIAYEVA